MNVSNLSIPRSIYAYSLFGLAMIWRSADYESLHNSALTEDITGTNELMQNAKWLLHSYRVQWRLPPTKSGQAPQHKQYRVETVLTTSLSSNSSFSPVSSISTKSSHHLIAWPPPPLSPNWLILDRLALNKKAFLSTALRTKTGHYVIMMAHKRIPI